MTCSSFWAAGDSGGRKWNEGFGMGGSWQVYQFGFGELLDSVWDAAIDKVKSSIEDIPWAVWESPVDPLYNSVSCEKFYNNF